MVKQIWQRQFKRYRRHPQDGWPMPLVVHPRTQVRCASYRYPRRRKNATWAQWKRWALECVRAVYTPQQVRNWAQLQALVPRSHSCGVHEFGDVGASYRGPYVVVDGRVMAIALLKRCVRCWRYSLVEHCEPETFRFLGYKCIVCQSVNKGAVVAHYLPLSQKNRMMLLVTSGAGGAGDCRARSC